MPVVEMLIRRGFARSGESLGRAERMFFEASRQTVLSTNPMGARGLGCSLKAVGPMPETMMSTTLPLGVWRVWETAEVLRTSPWVIVRKRVCWSMLTPLDSREEVSFAGLRARAVQGWESLRAAARQ